MSALFAQECYHPGFASRLCVLLTFFRLLDACIALHISSEMCVRMCSLPFYGLTYLYIFCGSLGVLFSIISLHWIIGALVGDDIFCFLVCFGMIVTLSLIIQSSSYLDCLFRHVLLVL